MIKELYRTRYIRFGLSCEYSTSVDRKVWINSEYFLIQQQFIHNTFLRQKRKWSTFPHNHLEGSGICHISLLVNVCIQHRILGFAKWTSGWEPLAFLSSEGRKMKIGWRPVWAVRWLFETLPAKLLQQGCHLSGCMRTWHVVTSIFGPLKKHLGGHRC